MQTPLNKLLTREELTVINWFTNIDTSQLCEQLSIKEIKNIADKLGFTCSTAQFIKLMDNRSKPVKVKDVISQIGKR